MFTIHFVLLPKHLAAYQSTYTAQTHCRWILVPPAWTKHVLNGILTKRVWILIARTNII